jgi:hypothetical protein
MNACLILSATFLRKRYVFGLKFSGFNFVPATFVRNTLYSEKYLACFMFFLERYTF